MSKRIIVVASVLTTMFIYGCTVPPPQQQTATPTQEAIKESKATITVQPGADEGLKEVSTTEEKKPGGSVSAVKEDGAY